MIYYLNTWSSQVVLSTEKTLDKENELIEKRLDSTDKTLTDRQKIQKLKKELDDIVYIEKMPFEIQEEFVRAKLSIAPHIWLNYDSEIKGRTIAIEIIKSQLERIHKFHSHMEAEKERKSGKRKS